ncbi:ribonuclease H-like domain-containing protein [Roseibacillus ishigakijimensis]|uniref:ribonuclease H-like domain-containing protein n=1 Tax=Roseibacillus ishigakijimensis TaxID=454146 RepID=UPI001F3AD924|nr:ribonuclease H-like domain-containing protein [Roseibacillus ishigakijimensis]
MTAQGEAVRDIVYFDLETQRSFNDVKGDKSKMGVSVAVTYSTKAGKYFIYGEDEMDALVQQLLRADLVVGHNHVEFDYPVLQKYTVLELAEQTLNLDTMLDLQVITGRRWKLDAVASGSLGIGKSASGVDALKWWQDYLKTGNDQALIDIAEYCAVDVKVTKCVYEYGVAHGHVKIDDGSAEPLEVAVDWQGE